MKPRVLIILCFLPILLAVGCRGERGFDQELDAITESYRFGTVSWEVGAFLDDIRSRGASAQAIADDERSTVLQYFSLAKETNALKSASDNSGAVKAVEDERGALERAVRGIMSRQIAEVLAAEDIYNPFDKYVPFKLSFPPVYFRLEEPPNLLVVSPRERIEYTRGIMLNPGTSVDEAVELERRVDGLGVSSLVVPLGGLATYPSFVVADYGLRFAIDVITEEWLHQYLAFTPLGFRYTLHLAGISRNPEIATMNETVASMVGKEIGAKVYSKYYREEQTKPPQPKPDYDFNGEMRAIRRAVDGMLGRGEIEAAEQFMNAKRDYLASKGYYIRKLNQAYFAFYSTYADSPTSIDPIGTDMRALREKSVSLKDFLDTASTLNNRQSLDAALKEKTGAR